MPKAAAFLDRDGVINRDTGYVYRWEDFEFLPGALDAMRKLQSKGYAIVIVTNQSGIARGYYTESQYRDLTKRVMDCLSENNILIEGVYHCPHHPKGVLPTLAIECNCRKPRPGLILTAARLLDLSLPHSILIGDKMSDALAARAAGVGRAYLVGSDQSEPVGSSSIVDGVFGSLSECVDRLVGGAVDVEALGNVMAH